MSANAALAGRLLADRLPPLLLTARAVAGVVSGAHGRRRPGTGDAFWQFRPAQAGDNSAEIDWRQSAKSDHPHIRETEAVGTADVHIWVDPSPSMNWCSVPEVALKSDRALVLGLALGAALLQAGERVTALGAPGRALSAPGQLERLAVDLIGTAGDQPPSPARPKRRQSVVLLSDFWAPLDTWSLVLRRLGALGLDGHLVAVTDPAEDTLPYAGAVRISGLAGEMPLTCPRIEDLRPAYRKRAARHQAEIADLARAQGWSSCHHSTDQAPASVLLALFHRLGARLR